MEMTRLRDKKRTKTGSVKAVKTLEVETFKIKQEANKNLTNMRNKKAR